MNVLNACECSGRVRDELRKRGHNAISCDLKPTEVPGPHIQGDVLQHLDDGWDMMIAHPDCTYIALSGVHWLNRRPGRWELLQQACTFFKALLDAPIPLIGLENPIPHRYAIELIGRKYDQMIQPWWFGDPESKATCLWLKGLPPLMATVILPKPDCGHWQNQTASGQNKLAPSDHRKADRARTYFGIARAMAEQWGSL